MNIWSNYFAYFALIGAFGFGLIYNRIYEHYRKQGKTKFYTAIAVVVGCAILILSFSFFAGWELTSFLFAIFAAAGAPMTWGDFNRSIEQSQKDLHDEIKRLKDRRGPRDWPTFAKNARDDTAEELNQLAIKLAQIQGVTDPQKLQTYLAHTLVVIHTSLRRLEAVGAPTQPPEP